MAYKLQDLIDVKQFQVLQDRLNEIYSFPSAIIDNDGTVLTATAWQDICTKFHRRHKESEKECIKSDQYITAHLAEADPAVSYRCPHGLIDNATPIIIDGLHLGNFFTGQFFLEKPDLEFFRRQAAKYGFDETAYLDAVKRVPVWTREQLNSYLFFIKGLIEVIASIGLKNLRALETAKDLSESEERYRTIIQTAMDGFWLTDTQWKLLQVNDAYCRMSGYSAEELRSMTIADLVAAHSPADITARMNQVMAAGQGRFETKHRRKDGTIYDVEVSTQYRSADKETFVAFLRDITERKRAEAALNELKVKVGSQELYSVLVEKAADGFWLLDRHFMTVYVNHSLETMLGYSSDEMIGRSWYDFGDPEWVARAKELERRRESGVSEPHNFLFIHKNGRRVLTRIATTPLYDRDGNFDGALGILSDITRQKEADEALKIKDMLNAIARSAGIGMCIVNPDYTIAWYNEMYEQWWGSLDKTAGRNCFEVFENRTEICPGCPARVSFETGGLATSERSPITNASGSDRTVALTTSPIRDADGAVLQVVEIAQDITERKRAEAALKESELRLKALIDAIPDAVIFKDVAGRHVIANRSNKRLFGLDPEMMIGKTAEDLLPAHLAASCRKNDEEVLKGKKAVQAEEYSVGPGGKKQILDSIKVPLYDGNGNAVGLVGLVRDITERREAEEKLRESEKFIRNILDTVDEGFIVVDRDYRIMTANRAYCEHASRPYDSIIGQHCYGISHGARRPCFEEGEECAVRQAFADGNPHLALHKHTGPDNTILYMETRAFPLKDSSGNVTSAIEVLTNITERHLLEEERLKTQKLEAVGTLAGGIAHDFNNLLQGVFGYISLAKMRSEGQQKTQEALKEAEKALHLTVKLTNQLLTFSKGGKPVKKMIDLVPLVENAAMFALSGSRTNFRLAAWNGLWNIEADEGQISQVIQNIVLNADQAMPDAGQVEIAARNVEAPGPDLPNDLAQGKYVEIAISDTGIGIHEKYLRRIFDPYFTTKEKGSGLGLATSYSIIKNHNGAIDVRSELGKGTTFRIYLPAAARPAPEAKLPEPAAKTSQQKGRILVMDDDTTILNVAGEMITALGHEAEFAANGAEAVDKYRAALQSGRPFNFAILDLTIRGGMGGVETLKKLLEIDPNTKAVVSSGYSDDSAIASYEKQGFKAMLKKPYTVDAVENILNRLLSA